MWVLTILSWLGTVLAFLFLTLSIGEHCLGSHTYPIASGLYYLSEFVEEHSELTKRTLQRLIYVTSPQVARSLDTAVNWDSL